MVTEGSKERHKLDLIDVLPNIENAGYSLSETKLEFFKTETEWVEQKNDRNGIGPSQNKLKAIQEMKGSQNEKELKSFSEQFSIYQNT